MPRFRRKPTEITAEQYRVGQPLPNGVCLCARMVMGPHVHTIHDGQQVELQDTDWVVPELDVGGKRFYPIKDSILQQTYESIEGDANGKINQ